MRTGKGISVALVVVTAVAGTALAGAAHAAAGRPAATGACEAYVYQGRAGTDPNGFAIPNETSYVASCLDAAGSSVARTERGPAATVTLGAPGSWAASVRQAGLGVGTTAARGRVLELSSGAAHTTTVTLQAPFLGVVSAVGAKGEPTIRVYDTGEQQVETYTLTSAAQDGATYLDFVGGTAVRATAATAASTSAAAPISSSARPSATPTTASPTPTPSAIASAIDAPGLALPPTLPPTSAPLTTSASGSHDGSHTGLRYGLAGGVAAFLVLLLLGLATARRGGRRPS